VAIMGSVLNNRLAHHLANVAADPANQPLNRKIVDLAHIHTNQIQGLLSPAGQHAATAHIAKLPPPDQHSVLQAYAHFVSGLKDALSNSISEVFLIGGLLVSLAFLVSWFLKEIPLRSTNPTVGP
jgi:hypothetical protein